MLQSRFVMISRSQRTFDQLRPNNTGCVDKSIELCVFQVHISSDTLFRRCNMAYGKAVLKVNSLFTVALRSFYEVPKHESRVTSLCGYYAMRDGSNFSL